VGTGVEEQAAAHVGAEVSYLPRAYDVNSGRGVVRYRGGGGGGGGVHYDPCGVGAQGARRAQGEGFRRWKRYKGCRVLIGEG
jgi:hypothetical protein